MSFTVTCECGRSLRVTDELRGKRVKCPSCGHKWTLPTNADSLAETKLADSMARHVPDVLDSLADDRACPACGSAMPGGEIVCKRCGCNIETGVSLTASAHEESQRRQTGGVPPLLGTVVSFVGKVAVSGLRAITPRGMPVSLTGGAVFVLFAIVGFAAGVVWSNGDSGKLHYLQQRIPIELTTHLSKTGHTDFDADRLKLVRLHEIQMAPESSGASRLRYDADVVVISQSQPIVVGRIGGYFTPGLLFFGNSLTDSQVACDFVMNDAFYTTFRITRPAAR